MKIWGIGNEMYGPWQWGHMLITQYAEKHNLMVRAMRKVDPTIKVIASGATPEEASWCYIENRQIGTFAGAGDGERAAAVRVRVEPGLDGGAARRPPPTTSTTSASTSMATRTW